MPARTARCRKYCRNHCTGAHCMHEIPLLSGLSKEELAEISAGVSTRLFSKGEPLFRAGDRADKLYIVCRGKVKIVKHSGEGKEQLLYILNNGDFFGAFNLLKADEFDCTAEALVDTEVSLLEKSEFDRIILSKPSITLKVFEKAYERIMKVEALAERLSTSSLDARVAGLLLNLARDFGKETERGLLLTLTISREDMANYSGIARETISRKLNLFQELGLVELISARQILIKDQKALEEMK